MIRCLARLTSILFALSMLSFGYVPETTRPLEGNCPAFDRWNMAQAVNRRWFAFVGQNVLCASGTGNACWQQVETVIQESFAAWTSVSGATLNFSALTQDSVLPCDPASDGRNMICLDSQMGAQMGPAILALSVITTARASGASLGGRTASFAGEILDADTVFNPAFFTFATPDALAANPSAYDLATILTHELGHWLGLDHSPLWHARMWPEAPPAGGAERGLSSDDRVAVAALYPSPGTGPGITTGIVTGKVTLPPDPSAGLPGLPIFGAHIVLLDANTGEAVTGGIAGWNCSNDQMVLDGGYEIRGVPFGSYLLYAEPLDGPMDSSELPSFLAGFDPPPRFDLSLTTRFH
jgi:hypothetical protein